MPIASNFTSVYSKDWEINFMQCTPNGFLKYVDLCNLIQLTAAAHSEIGGISFVDMQQFDQAWVLSRMRVEIEALPKWKDCITIKTWINTLEHSRSIRAIEVSVNGKKMIGAETFWAVFNTRIRRPESLSLPHEQYEKFPEDRATAIPFSKITLGEEKQLVSERTVVLSDLDMVNHVNNVKYLEWCLDTLEEKIILNRKMKSFEMNFLRELSLKDKVAIYENHSTEQMIFSIDKDDKPVFALALQY